MRRSFLRCWIVLAGLPFVATGCGDLFAPPSRIKSVSRSDKATAAKPNFLIFVSPGPLSGDLDAWAYRSQLEANDKRAIFRIMGPSPPPSEKDQPEIIRMALAEGASALIVCAGDSPDLGRTLADAEAKGVPVILIDKPVAAPEGSKPFTVVEFAPFEETARQIVGATIEDLKKAKQPVDGTALILVDTKNIDRNSGRRAEALKAASAAAGFRKIVTVPFDGSQQEAGKLAVIEAVKANPDTSIVLAENGEGLVSGALARVELKGKPIVFVGGYTDYRNSPVVTPPNRESCHVEGRFIELGSQAVLAALARLRGETVAEHVYVTPRFVKTEAGVSSETEANSSFPDVKANMSPDEPNLKIPQKKEDDRTRPQ